MDYKTEFSGLVEYTIQKDRLQFYCEECLKEKNCPKPKPMYENTGYCNNCGNVNDVSNPYFNAWFEHNRLSLNPKENNSGYELRELIPWHLANIEVQYKNDEL